MQKSCYTLIVMAQKKKIFAIRRSTIIYSTIVIGALIAALIFGNIRHSLQDQTFNNLPACSGNTTTSCKRIVKVTADEVNPNYENFFIDPGWRFQRSYMTRMVLDTPFGEETILTEQRFYNLHSGETFYAYANDNDVIAIEAPDGIYILHKVDPLYNWLPSLIPFALLLVSWGIFWIWRRASPQKVTTYKI